MGALCGSKRSNVVQPSASKISHSATARLRGDLQSSDMETTTDGLSHQQQIPWGDANSSSAQKRKISDINQQSVLKKYEMQATIGEGSFSKVFRVQNRHTNELFALKITDKAKSLESGMPCYKRELAILKRIDHTNIIKLYEVFYSHSKVYLILELALGGDLFDRLASNGPYNEPLAQKTINMITEGIHYLHQLSITHRDLKLENLLYKNSRLDSKILISDFGLSHMREGGVQESLMCTTCGSEEYTAPEVLDGYEYTESVDMWALGIVAYSVLCGYMPFSEANRTRLHSKIRSGLLVFKEQAWQRVSPTCKQFVCQLLEVNPTQRLTAYQALQHPWLNN